MTIGSARPMWGSIAQTAGARRPRPYDLRASARGGDVSPAQSQPTTMGRGRPARADHNTWGGGVPPALPSFDNGPRSHFLSAGPRRPRPNATSPHIRGGGIPPAQNTTHGAGASRPRRSQHTGRGRPAPAERRNFPFTSSPLSKPLQDHCASHTASRAQNAPRPSHACQSTHPAKPSPLVPTQH